jgi:hypothetical protein
VPNVMHSRRPRCLAQDEPPRLCSRHTLKLQITTDRGRPADAFVGRLTLASRWLWIFLQHRRRCQDLASGFDRRRGRHLGGFAGIRACDDRDVGIDCGTFFPVRGGLSTLRQPWAQGWLPRRRRASRSQWGAGLAFRLRQRIRPVGRGKRGSGRLGVGGPCRNSGRGSGRWLVC